MKQPEQNQVSDKSTRFLPAAEAIAYWRQRAETAEARVRELEEEAGHRRLDEECDRFIAQPYT